MAKSERISMSVIRRLPRYYRFLYDLKENGVVRISSKELSQRMGLTASQIRQDLNCFGGFGQQGYGYVVEQLYAEIGRILGLDVLTPAILLGAGNLGRAVANHMDFEQKGFRLVAIFDDSPSIIGQKIRGMEVLPTKLIEETCRRQNVKVAVLCIPKEAAASIVEYLISLDIRGFWNFSHFDIGHHYPGVLVENVHLGDSLMTLSYKLTAGGEK
ncbi:MAG TPA: redox-sensing transcriptional repressor Rex [Candidatus Avimonas sp.]|jgi:redox-sensing transcriptional repressor|nr:redox-sensing transcriptional repressor Rex [Clostridiales bacterium]HOB36216.1 redox-sensing transcriptional repressor Rex [Candidatus Avimonas sp.]HQA16339.1 redox-sensing transcriptional repressor Rex [Candidatus Avimonas sp.]HQD38720.1 redox-sensing transcriptional repressor Rex [Candidatus Avimonas sp.]